MKTSLPKLLSALLCLLLTIGTSAQSVTTFNYSGSIVNYTVPAGVTSIVIEAFGAEGGGTTLAGGKGAQMKGTFSVSPGEVLRILVGQKGGSSGGNSNYNGGGGGSFIVRQSSGTPLLIAGGGGGGPETQTSTVCPRNINLAHGQVSTFGSTMQCDITAFGGSNGSGGQARTYSTYTADEIGGAGAGFLGDGIATTTSGCTGSPGRSFTNGGAGGSNNCVSNAYGGFGGGGAGGKDSPGAGGGYSGGATAATGGIFSLNGSTYGGGGGSYNTGTNQLNVSGVRTGNGLVTITNLTPATALRFDPSLTPDDDSRLNYVNVANPYRAFQKEMTVEFWMYVPNARLPFGSIMGQGASNVDANWVWLMHPEDNGTMNFYVNDGGTFRSTNCTIKAGEWHHYAATASAASTKFYVDGVLVHTGPGVSGTILSNGSSVIHIGKDVRYATRNIPNDDPWNRYATMTLDEVRIWSRALCIEEINANKNVEINPTGQNGLQQYYRFNQGVVNGDNSTVTTLTDLSGNNRNGTLNNFILNGTNSNWTASGSTNTGTVNPFVIPTAPIIGTNLPFCVGQSRTLTNAIPGGKWASNNPAAITIDASTGLLNFIASGSTTISYTTPCGGVSYWFVSANPLPTPAVAGTNTICSGSSTTLTASGGNSYSWNTGATTAAITVSPAVTTTYTATATNVNGCTAQASRTVTVNALPTVTASSNSPVSTGNNLQLSANGAYSYAWSGPNGFNSTAQNPVINNITSAANGTYSVTGTTLLGCTNTASVNVTVLATPATALKTDGVDDYVTINNPFRSFDKAITVEFWMNTPTGKLAQGSIMGQSSLNVDGMGTDVWLMHPDIGGTNLDFYVNDAGTWRRATVPIIAGGWHHYVGVASEFGIKFYVDGVLKKSETGISNGILSNANAIMQIGKDPRHTNFRFADMSIDEVRVWSRALCEAEIINNKNCELNPTGQTGLQEYYRFNQGFVGANNSTEITLTDLSGNNRNGVLNGFALTGNNSNWIESGFVSTANCSPYIAPISPITGNTSLCIGNNTTLGNATTGGLWSSSNIAVATINANTGVVNALSAGATTITYRTECGGVATTTLTINAFPVATISASGNTSVCPGATVSLQANTVTNGVYQWKRNGVDIGGANSSSYKASSTGSYSATITVGGCTSVVSNAISVTVADTENPVITCPAPITVNNTPNTCGAVVNFINPTATDNCTGGAFNFFSVNEPNNYQGLNEDYIQLYTNGTWNDLPNSSLNNSIVEFNDIRSNTYTGYNLIGSFEGHTYYLSTSGATWTSSRSAAQAIGGDLASINTLGESSFLAPYGGNTWVGGYQDKTVPGFQEPGNANQNFVGWKWVDGTQLGAGQIVITQTAGLPSGSVFPVGVTTNTFTATDESGNASTCSFTVTVRDVQPPVISCPANITVTAASAAGAVVNYVAPVGTDNCSGATTVRIAGPASGATFPLGTTTVTHRVTDAAGNFMSCSFTVTVSGQAPVIVSPGNQTVNVVPGTCAATVNYVATETTGIPASTITYSIAPGSTFGVGSTLVTATATNIVGSSSVQFTVTVIDNEKPAITCLPNQSLDLDATCKATLPDYRSLLTVSDNCTPAGSLVITQSPTAGTIITTKGSMIITFTVTDASNNSSTCTITLDKKDVTAPVITCRAPIVVNATSNTCGAVVNFINPTATDNCTEGAFTFFFNGEPNEFFGANEDYIQLYTNGTWNDLPNSSANRSIVEFNDIRSDVYAGYERIGTYGGHTYYLSTVGSTWVSSRSAAQAIGGDLASINTKGESEFLGNFIATKGTNAWVGGYQDKTVPGFQEPGNASQNYLGWKWVDGTQLGAGQITITQTAGLPSGSVFPVGVTTNTFIARDESGNESTCSFTVTVRDVQPPVINCPSNISATATSAAGAVVNYTTPVGTDNCSGATTERTAGLASGSTFPIGTTTVTYRVTDAAGLSTQCSFTVTVVGVAPVITCPANTTVNAAAGTCAANVNFAATETVGIPASTITYTINGNPVVSGASFPVGTTTVVATATNAVGSSSCSFTVTVVDDQNPTITAPANVQGNNTPGLCTGTVTLGTPVTADNCGVASVDNDAPSIFPVGSTTVTWTVTDIHGNTATTTQTVVIVDNEKPTISTSDVSVNNDASKCGATVTIAQPTTGDNCGVLSVMGVRSDDALLTADYPVGTTTITWTVRDVNGNSTTTTQTIVVADNEKPTISVTNVSVNNDAVKCGASIVIAQPNTDDNCGVATVMGVRSDNALLTADYPVGTTTITWTVRDVNGNSTTTTQTIVVADNEKPTISVTNVSVNNDAAKCGASIAIAQPNTADNCGVATVMGVRSDNALLTADYPVGTTTITWTVTDVHGNTVSATQTVVVKDTEAPVVATNNITIQLAANGQASITTTQINNGSSDNCGIATVTLSKLNFDCSNVGNNTVVLTVTDIHGNSATANATVTVQDNIAPTVITKPVTVTLVNGAATITANQVNNGSFDNCGIATMTVSPASFNCNNIGTNTVTLTVTDVNGNTASKTAIVTVVGQLPTCSITSVPTSNVYTGGNPNNIYLGYGAQSTVLNVSATGGSSYTYQWNGTATQMLSSTTAAAPVFTPTAPGNYTFTVTVTNNFGCTSTCTITICVKDIRVPGTGLKGSPAKVYICHLPPGNKNNPQTLEISVNAVATHIGQHSGDRLGTCDMTPCAEPTPTVVANALVSKAVVEAESKAVSQEELKVTVMPNPTKTYFTLKIESKYDAPVSLKVMDALGRIIDVKAKLGSNATVEIGHNYNTGSYFAEFIQGNRRKVVQLLKVK